VFYSVLLLLQHFGIMCFTDSSIIQPIDESVAFSNFFSVVRWHITYNICIWEGCVVVLNLVFIMLLLLLNFNLIVFDFHNGIHKKTFFIMKRKSETTCFIYCSEGFTFLLQWKLSTNTVILEMCSVELWSFMVDS
jgi:hypothetical protein